MQLSDCAFPAEGQAWVWRAGELPTQLVCERRPVLRPAVGEVLVRNYAIGLNPVDWKVIQAAAGSWTAGHIPGVDGAGEVVAIGAGVDSAWLGRRVAYHTSLARDGSFAEYVQVAARALLQVPAAMSLETAAGIPCPALTAWLALDKVPLREQAPVLITGAGGAVGLYLVQLAVARGFTVSVQCHPRHWARLRALGVQSTFASSEPLPASTSEAFHAVFDSVNEAHAASVSSALAANGHLVCIQGRVAQWPSASFGRALSLHEVALGALHQYGDEHAWQRLTAAGAQLLQAVADNELQAEPLLVRDFSDLPEHLDALRQRAFCGKPVVRVDI